ncbi:hypothetical protein ANCCAN_26237 [Ancylostoma caninum]|uniref:Uncharacterized protein n=1 Tax=Ancylostoma caninum TaxID=29170 RepID=A0A368F794_ANCCA|nr:hypothetical protein ANCCAN_26237 [Ancylostoma caninum]
MNLLLFHMFGGQTWIISAKILDFDRHSRMKKINTLLISTISCGTAPDEDIFAKALNKFRLFLIESCTNGFEVIYGEQEFKLRFTVTCSVMDNQAVAKCFRTAEAASYHGCYRCFHPGVYSRLSKSITWPEGDYPERTQTDYESDATLGLNGIRGQQVLISVQIMKPF